MITKLRILIPIFTVIGCLLIILTGCPQNPEIDPPTLTTSEVIGITSNWAISGGVITNDGGTDINERGVCWSTTNPPSTDDQKSTAGIGSGEYTCKLNNLEGNTTYYISAYASNSEYTGYGEVVTFSTPPMAIDVEGNEFPTVIIGTQTWMARNLSITHYRNGDPITYIPVGESWGETESGEYCDYDLIGTLGGAYGYFYNWYVLSDSRGICPDGWHVPSEQDWNVLIEYLGGMLEAGVKLRETGFSHWLKDVYEEATNESGFTALPAGMQGDDHRGVDARFWTSTTPDANNAMYYGVAMGNQIFWANAGLSYGISVRLVKNQ